jgi:hypothetical protein
MGESYTNEECLKLRKSQDAGSRIQVSGIKDENHVFNPDA